MRIKQEVIDNIRESTDIVSLISSYVDLKGSGNRYTGLCPFHKESTPSFHVSSDKQLYHCFGCGASGNSISFLMQIENYDFLDAVKHLAELNNITIEASSEDYEKKKREKELLIEINTKAARFFYKNLHSDEGIDALEYVTARNIDVSMQTKFGLGYATNSFTDLYDFLKKEGYNDEIIGISGLVTQKNGKTYDKFINRIMFPIFDVYGKVVAFGGRILGEGMPKYLNSPETLIFNKSKILYNLNYAKNEKGRSLILVEGYMDALMLYQWGIKNVVAALGTAFNENHVATLKKYCDKVYLLFDNDEAGLKAVDRAIPFIIDKGLKVRIVKLYGAKDPDEFIKKYGREKFIECVKTSIDNIEFKIEELNKKFNLQETAEKLEFIEEAIKLLNTLNNDIERKVYIDKISSVTGIEKELIQKELKIDDNYSDSLKKKLYIRNSVSLDLPKNVLLSIVDIANFLVYDKHLALKIANKLDLEYILDEDFKKLFKIIYEKNSNSIDFTIDSLVDYFETVEAKNKIGKIFMTFYDYEESITSKIISESVKTVIMHYIDVKSSNCTDINEVVKLNELRKNTKDLCL